MIGRLARLRAPVVVALVVATCAVVPAAAATASNAPDVEARAFEVRYRPLADAVDLVSAVLSEAGTVSLQPRLRRLVVQDRADVLDRVAQVLADLDVPPRNVEVSVSLFLGTDRRDAEAGRLAHPPDVAEETRGIRETLGDFTRWTEFSPLGSRTITCVEGYPGTVYLADDYRVEFHVDRVDGEDRVTFDRFTLMKVVRTVDGEERVVPQYDAAIHIPVGKELLVGAASGPDSSAALFLKLLVRVR